MKRLALAAALALSVASTTPAAAASPIIRTSATWYCLPGVSSCTHGHNPSCACAAAGWQIRHALRNWRGRLVWVAYRRHAIRVQLVDWNMGPGIDLYASAFRRIAPLGRGRIFVRVFTAPVVTAQ